VLESIVFVGWAVGCIILSPLADHRGRKGVFLASVFMQFIVWILILIIKVTELYFVIYFLCFLFGLDIAGRYTVGYVYLTESMPKAYRARVGLLLDLSEALIMAWICLYFKIVSKDWEGL
jgi:MFS family permease